MNFEILAFYKFGAISKESLPKLKSELLSLMEKHEVLGSIILAPEGINGMLSGTKGVSEIILNHLRKLAGFEDMFAKYSFFEKAPFTRRKVKLKNEIVTFHEDIKLEKLVDQKNLIDPDKWDKILSDPEYTVVDTRNDYEVEAGTFKGATDPKIATFIDFKEFTEKNLDPVKNKKLAIFCTGGIRCEKAGPYLENKGFEVKQLKGGILNYIEKTPKEQSAWEGNCFVFDERRTLNHNLEKFG